MNIKFLCVASSDYVWYVEVLLLILFLHLKEGVDSLHKLQMNADNYSILEIVKTRALTFYHDRIEGTEGRVQFFVREKFLKFTHLLYRCLSVSISYDVRNRLVTWESQTGNA